MDIIKALELNKEIVIEESAQKLLTGGTIVIISDIPNLKLFKNLRDMNIKQTIELNNELLLAESMHNLICGGTIVIANDIPNLYSIIL